MHRSIGLLVTTMSIVAVNWCAPHAVASPGKALNSTAVKKRKILLRGHVDELSYFCSSAGLRLSGSQLPATVAKISLGSAAAYSGVQEGDKVLRIDTDDNAIILRI